MHAAIPAARLRAALALAAIVFVGAAAPVAAAPVASSAAPRASAPAAPDAAARPAPGESLAAPAPGESPVAVAPVAGSALAPRRDYLAEARAGFTPVDRAYNRTRIALRIFGPLYSLVVLLVLLFTGLARRFREIAHALGHNRYVQVLVTFSLFAGATWLLELPLSWFTDYALEHQYGLSTQSFGGWMEDSFKELVVNLVTFGVVPLLAVVWSVVQRWPRGWWWRLAIGTVPVAMAAALLGPVLVDPLYNKFTPLPDSELRTRILALAERAHIPARRVYVVNMSARTKKINAYVDGFGASQRIVLWDTTLRTLSPDEILVVMGHEMGHYALGHIWRIIIAVGVGAFAMLFVAERIVAWLLRAFGRAWGVTGPADLAALPVFALALGTVTTLAEPGVALMGRHLEHQADVYALEITHDNDAAARAFLKLARDNRSDPEPAEWVRVLFFDHPPLGERIRFALSYRPWEHGQPNRLYHPRP